MNEYEKNRKKKKNRKNLEYGERRGKKKQNESTIVSKNT